jgi:DNA-binding MarR family transcriptional regulator
MVTMGGRPPSVSAEEVVQAIALYPEPIVTARDIHDDIGLQPASALKRLNRLVDEGYLRKKKVGSSAAVYWISDEGRDLLADNCE